MDRSAEVLLDHAYDGGYDVFAEYGKGKPLSTAGGGGSWNKPTDSSSSGSYPSYGDQQEGTEGTWPAGEMCTPSNDDENAFEGGSRPGYGRTAGYDGEDGSGEYGRKTEEYSSRPTRPGYGGSESQGEGGYRKPLSNVGSAFRRSGTDYDSGNEEGRSAWRNDTGWGEYGARRAQNDPQEDEYSEEGNRRPFRRQECSAYSGEGDSGYHRQSEHQRAAYGRSNEDDKLASETSGLSIGSRYEGGGDHHGRDNRKYDDY